MHPLDKVQLKHTFLCQIFTFFRFTGLNVYLSLAELDLVRAVAASNDLVSGMFIIILFLCFFVRERKRERE